MAQLPPQTTQAASVVVWNRDVVAEVVYGWEIAQKLGIQMVQSKLVEVSTLFTSIFELTNDAHT